MNIAEVSEAEITKAVTTGDLSKDRLLFIVDVGASNTRLGLTKRGATTVNILFVKYSVKSIKSLIAVMHHFSTVIGDAVCSRIGGAALNLPGPVQGAVGGPISNYEGSSPSEKVLLLKDLPTKLCPLHHTVMLNDLEACAYGVVAANRFPGVFGSLFQTLWRGSVGAAEASKPVTSLPEGHCIVVAPGTGLGAAVVQFHSFSGKFTVLPLEMGHTTVQSHTDEAFQRAFGADMKRGPYLPEYDDICSGRGLEALYGFLSKKAVDLTRATDVATAAQISQMAKSGDAVALEAVSLYHRFLMRFCSQMAIGFVPSAIILCGDNVVHNDFFYRGASPNGSSNVDVIRATMLEHSTERMGFMSRPHLLRQKAFANLNLLGCLYVSEDAARRTSKL